MAHYLITGGCGFIGSHLAELLLAKGHRVRVLDNLLSGKRSNVPASVEIIEDTILNPEAVAKAMKGVDACFHLAAIPSVVEASKHWFKTHQTNLSGTICIFEEAAHLGIPVVYASSAAMYGNPAILPVAEAHAAKPLTAYGLDKYCCELNAGLAGIAYGLPTFGLRFFNVYGPRQDPSSPYSGVISKFAQCIQQKNKLTIFDDGEQTRDFVFVKDIVACVYESLKHASAEAPVCNIGTGTAVTINHLAKEMLAAAKASLPVEHAPAQPGQLRYSVSDASKMKSYFPQVQCTPLAEGLTLTLKKL